MQDDPAGQTQRWEFTEILGLDWPPKTNGITTGRRKVNLYYLFIKELSSI
jgi:hypothetical protein